jgi:hypothetical protein
MRPVAAFSACMFPENEGAYRTPFATLTDPMSKASHETALRGGSS